MRRIIFPIIMSILSTKLGFTTEKSSILNNEVLSNLKHVESYINKKYNISDDKKDVEKTFSDAYNKKVFLKEEYEFIKKEIASATNNNDTSAPKSQRFIGSIYLKGHYGMEANIDKAAKWFIKSAINNDIFGMIELHYLLEKLEQKDSELLLKDGVNIKSISSNLLEISKKKLGNDFDIYY